MVARTRIDDDNKRKPVLTNQFDNFHKGNNAMPEEFDPYRKWLGIPPKDQPPHYYRLLGIALLEDDPDVIENAANRQMAHVRTFQNSKHSSLSQKILNELSAAKLCLLRPDEKSEYDAKLKARLKAEKKEKEARRASSQPSAKAAPPPKKTPPPQATPPTGVPVPKPVQAVPVQAVPGQPLPTGQPMVGQPVPAQPVPSQAAPAAPAPQVPAGPVVSTGRSSSSSRRSSRRKSSPVPMLIGAVVVVGLLVVVLAVAMNSTPPKPVEKDPDPPAVLPNSNFNSGNRRPRPRPNLSNRPRKNGWGPRDNGGNPTTLDPLPNEFKPAPPTFPKFEPFKEAVAEVRNALAKRDGKRADERLLTAADNAKTDEEKATVDDLEILATYVSSFWSAVQRGARDRKENPAFEHDGVKYEFIDHGGDGLVYKVNGEMFTTKIRQLPAEHAVAFAHDTLDADTSFGRFYLAAFMLVDGTDENSPLRAKAVDVYKQAVANGNESAPLARALKLVPASSSAANNESVGEPNDPATPDPNPETNDPTAGNPTDPALPEVERLAAPTAEEAKQARINMNQKYTDSLDEARRDPSARRGVAQQMFDGAEAINDPKLRFVVLEFAATMAAQSGDLDLALQAARQLGAQYEVNAFEYALDVLTTLSTARGSDSKGVIRAAIDLKNEAADQYEYGAARRAAEVASRVAAKEKLFQQQRALNSHVRWLESMEDEKVRADRAEAALSANPEDPRAALSVGRYLCYCKGDWAGGLALLSKCSSTEDQEIAKRELSSPTAAEDMLALAKEWYLNGRRKKGPVGYAMLQRSEHWYTSVMDQLEPAARIEAEKRVSEIQESMAALLPEEIPPLEEEAAEPDPLAPDQPE